MGVVNIRESERQGARLVIGLAGISGSGKTYTALQLAFGLANYNSKKVGMLDTENRRGSLYANVMTMEGAVHRFLIGDLSAPFSPQRYKEAILEFQAAGVEVLVIDSVSHEWEGVGGCEDIATAGNPRVARWNDAKSQHKQFMNTLLQSDMHIISCLRAREKVKVVKEVGTNKTIFEPIGIMPICEKNFVFELTASLMMWDEGRSQQVLKCPSELRDILGRETGYITAADGKALREWVDGAVQIDKELERARNLLRTTTEQGEAALAAAWTKTPAAIKVKLGESFKDELKRSAREFDKQRRAASEGGEAVADLNDAVLGKQSTAT